MKFTQFSMILAMVLSMAMARAEQKANYWVQIYSIPNLVTLHFDTPLVSVQGRMVVNNQPNMEFQRAIKSIPGVRLVQLDLFQLDIFKVEHIDWQDVFFLLQKKLADTGLVLSRVDHEPHGTACYERTSGTFGRYKWIAQCPPNPHLYGIQFGYAVSASDVSVKMGTQSGVKLADKLVALNGVQEVTIRHNYIQVIKVPGAAWTSLQPLVMQVLQESLSKAEPVGKAIALDEVVGIWGDPLPVQAYNWPGIGVSYMYPAYSFRGNPSFPFVPNQMGFDTGVAITGVPKPPPPKKK